MRKKSILVGDFNLMEFFWGIVFVFPYIEIRPIKKMFEISFHLGYIPASVVIMSCTILILLVASLFKKNDKVKPGLYKILLIKVFLDIIILLRGLYVDHISIFLSQFLWFIIPFYFSFVVFLVIKKYNFDVIRISKIGIGFYCLYLVLNIVINISKYGFSIENGEIRSRLLSPGGGPVILGYTIVLVLTYMLSIRDNISIPKFYVYISVLIIGSLFTGSRGSIWTILLIILFYFLVKNKNKLFFIINLFILGFSFLAFKPINHITSFVPRIMNLDGGSRTVTLYNSLELFAKQPISNILFGTGISGFFPYTNWLTNHGTVENNTFIYNGKILLVQPHNTYLYLLIETGLIGLLIFVIIFIMFFVNLEDGKNKFYHYLVVFSALLLNNFDAIFLVQPSASSLWWLILFFVLDNSYTQKMKVNKKINFNHR